MTDKIVDLHPKPRYGSNDLRLPSDLVAGMAAGPLHQALEDLERARALLISAEQAILAALDDGGDAA